MAHPASDTCRCFGRAAAYAVYNLGVGILVGFARVIVSTYYLAKQFFYKEAYNQNASRLGNGITRLFADVSVGSFQDTKIDLWKGELVRGLVEMVPLIGTAYFTYKDNQTEHHFIGKDTYKASTYGIKELGKLIGNEYRADQAIRRTLGSDTYNPIDLRFHDWIRS